MTSKSKAIGNRVEREVVQLALAHGMEAKRAYGSNGEALGQSKETDILVAGKYRLQVKKKENFPKWLMEADENVDAVVFKSNNKPFKVMIDLDTYFRLLRMTGDYR
jgi:Holliday junction resolvase